MLIYAYHPKNSEKHQIQLLTQQERVAAYTPSGNVNPHQPILKGNGDA